MTVGHDPVEAQVEIGLVLAVAADQVFTIPDQPVRREVVQHAHVHVEGIADEVLGLEVNRVRSEEHTSELQSQSNLVCRLLLEKKKKKSTDACRRRNKDH